MKVSSIILIIFLYTNLYSTEYVLAINNNTQIEKLSNKQIKDIFLMKRHFVKSTNIIPINLSASLEIRKVFENKVLKIKRQRLNNYWTQQHFQGVRPPIIQSSVNSVKLFLKSVDGAVGYMPLTELDADLKVVYEF